VGGSMELPAAYFYHKWADYYLTCLVICVNIFLKLTPNSIQPGSLWQPGILPLG
jgi:hypothetical protein